MVYNSFIISSDLLSMNYKSANLNINRYYSTIGECHYYCS